MSEALKIAIKSLELIANVNAMDYEYQKEARDALESIKAALEAKDEPDYKALWQQMCERCDELDKKLAHLEAKDEPVAWVCDGEVRSLWWDKNQALDRNAGHEFTPLYATPPQRTWVGLTDKDWNRSKHNYDFQKGVDWAESILKEKNA